MLTGALEEKLSGVGARDGLRAGLRIGQWQRGQGIGSFDVYAKRLPARRDDGYPPGLAQQDLGQAGARIEHVLAVVEHQQHLLRLQVTAQGADHGRRGGLLHAQDMRQRVRHQRRIGQRCEVDEPDAVAIGIENFRRGLQREARLADAAGAGQRQQACSRQELLDLGQLPFAADERIEHLRKIGALPVDGHGRLGLAGDCDDRTDKTITPPRQRFDPVLSTRHAGERPPDRGDLGREIVLLDDQARPRGIHDGRLLHEFVRPADERGQHPDAARSERDRDTRIRQHMGVRAEPEWPDFIDEAHGTALRARPASEPAAPCGPRRDPGPAVEPRRNDSNFIDYAEFFHDFAERRTDDRLGHSSIAKRCAATKSPAHGSETDRQAPTAPAIHERVRRGVPLNIDSDPGFTRSVQGQLLRQSDCREVAIFLRDGALWVADFIDGEGQLIDAATWFRFNCGTLASPQARRRMVLESATPLSKELAAKIQRLHHCATMR